MNFFITFEMKLKLIDLVSLIIKNRKNKIFKSRQILIKIMFAIKCKKYVSYYIDG